MPFTRENWLCLDLSTSRGTLSLHHWAEGKGKRLVQEVIGESYDHSENLIKTLQSALATAGLNFGDLDRYVTASGPGSFTGLRIAFSTLKAFSFITGKPIETLSGSEARFLAWRESRDNVVDGEKCLVLSSAAARKFVVAPFLRTPSGWEKSEDLTITGSEVPVYDGKVTVLTDTSLANAKLEMPETYEVLSFPLEAQHLGTALPLAQTRKTSVGLEEWVTLSPDYFGTTKLVEVTKA